MECLIDGNVFLLHSHFYDINKVCIFHTHKEAGSSARHKERENNFITDIRMTHTQPLPSSAAPIASENQFSYTKVSRWRTLTRTQKILPQFFPHTKMSDIINSKLNMETQASTHIYTHAYIHTHIYTHTHTHTRTHAHAVNDVEEACGRHSREHVCGVLRPIVLPYRQPCREREGKERKDVFNKEVSEEKKGKEKKRRVKKGAQKSQNCEKSELFLKNSWKKSKSPAKTEGTYIMASTMGVHTNPSSFLCQNIFIRMR